MRVSEYRSRTDQLRCSAAIAVLFVGLSLVRVIPQAEASGAPILVVSFEKPGQVCASEAEEKAVLDALTASRLPLDAQITLVSYSDRVDLRNPNWSERPDCIPASVPDDLKGHERIAALRAMYVISIARRAGHRAFSRPPLFLKGERSDIASRSHVVVQCDRTLGEGPEHRRVEIRWTADETAVAASSRCAVCPESPPNAAQNQPALLVSPSVPPSFSANAEMNRPRWRRPAGWLTLTAGSAGVALAAAFFGVGGALENQGRQALDAERRIVLSEQANSYYRAGGGVAAVGVSLTVAGIYLLVSSKTEKAAVGERLVADARGK